MLLYLYLPLFFFKNKQITKKSMQINIREYLKGNQRMNNPEKLGTQGTQDKDKQNKNTTHYRARN